MQQNPKKAEMLNKYHLLINANSDIVTSSITIVSC